jgi:hypothetical protein
MELHTPARSTRDFDPLYSATEKKTAEQCVDNSVVKRGNFNSSEYVYCTQLYIGCLLISGLCILHVHVE